MSLLPIPAVDHTIALVNVVQCQYSSIRNLRSEINQTEREIDKLESEEARLTKGDRKVTFKEGTKG